MNKPWSKACQKRVIQPDALEEAASKIRRQGHTIATLNGSFDLLHAGHLQIIYEASKLADVLIVALNSDSSIRQYKSPNRPIIPLEYRLQIITALRWVGYASWFEETTPLAFLEKIKPDVHVNGSEYGEECIEAEAVRRNGGRIHIVPLVNGLSTSEVIEKIQAKEQDETSPYL